MEHLTIDELIEFVSMSRIDNASMQLASKVNMHIGECEDCLNKLRAFQSVYDGLNKSGDESDYQTVVSAVEKNKKTSIIYEKTDKLDGPDM